MRERIACEDTIVTTRFCVAELYVGLERLSDPARSRESKRIEEVVFALDVLDFDHDAARVFARIKADLYDKGKPSGDMDTLIAAVAVVNGHDIVTRNARHFTGMPGVGVLGY